MRHSLGRVVATVAVAASVPEAVMVGLLDRHVARDWGDLDVEEKASKATRITAARSTPIIQLKHRGAVSIALFRNCCRISPCR